MRRFLSNYFDLLLIYVNDIHNAIPEVNIKLFADDTNILFIVEIVLD